MTELETTVVADATAETKLGTPGKENGTEAASPSPSPVAEVELGDGEQHAGSDAPAAVNGKDDDSVAGKSSTAEDAPLKVVEEPAAATNGDAAGSDTQPTEAAADASVAAPEAAASSAAEPATEPTAEAAAEPAAQSAADAEEPKAEAQEGKADTAEPKAEEQPETAAKEEVAEAQAEQQSEQQSAADQQEEAPKAEEKATSEADPPAQEEAKGASEEAKPAEEPAAGSDAAKADTAAGSKESLANGGAGEAAAAEAAAAASANDASLVTAPGTVQALTRRLSSNSLQGQPQPTTPPRSVPGDKGQLSAATAVAAVGVPLLSSKASKSPTAPRSGETPPLSTHDSKNTINISQLLKLGAFKMQPLKDFVPYAELLRLRVEDGIDATRKEDYLNDEDFKQVFGMDRDAFKKQPAWRQVQAKKKANLF